MTRPTAPWQAAHAHATRTRATRPRTALMRATRLLLPALCLIVVACTSKPPPSPDSATISVFPISMEGVTHATVHINAPGPWTLDVTSSDTVLGSQLALSATSGTGPHNLTLTVDPTGVYPASYGLTLRLVAEVSDGLVLVNRDLTFSFPRVYGTVVVQQDVRQAASPVPAHTDAHAERATTQRAERPTSAPLLNADGTVTLIVDVAGPGVHLKAGSEGANTEADGSAPTIRGVAVPGVSLDLAAAVEALPAAALQLHFAAAGVLLIDVPADQFEAASERLAAAAGVVSVTPSIELEQYQAGFPNDHEYPRQWNFGRVGMANAWQTARGVGVTIAIIDGGFYPAHPDLQSKVVGQYDFGTDSPSVTVEHAACGTHGTHVAGIAAAATHNSIGVAGAAPAAGLLLLDIDAYNPASQSCTMSTSALIKALEHVYNGGTPRAQVVNMSIGSVSPLGGGVQSALDTLRNNGVVLIAAAGNTACPGGFDTFKPISYPAAYASVWAIGATDPVDDRSCYSHIGPELFMMAPGGDDWFAAGSADQVISTVYDVVNGTSYYDYMQGTSMAAPLVAGVVALMLEAEPNASIVQLEQALINTSVDLGTPGFDTEYGFGLLDAAAALAELIGSEPPPDPLGLLLDVDRYPITALGHHREFVLVDSEVGLVTIEVYSDDDGDGVPGGSGEFYGVAVVDVSFDSENFVTIHVQQQP